MNLRIRIRTDVHVWQARLGMLLLEVMQSCLKVLCPGWLALLLTIVFRGGPTSGTTGQLCLGLCHQFDKLLLFCKAVLMLQQSRPQSL